MSTTSENSAALLAQLRAARGTPAVESHPKPRAATPKPPAPDPTSAALPPDVERMAVLGFRCLPCKARTKIAALKAWERHATAELGALRKMARQRPECNWASVADRRIILDVDDPAALARLEEKHGPLPRGPRILTRRGFATLFQAANGYNFHPQQKCPCEGIDLTTGPHYQMIPPSIHPTGTAYRWQDEGLPIPDCPEWLLGLIAERQRPTAQPARPAPQSATAASEKIAQGGRWAALSTLVGKRKRQGVAAAAIEVEILAVNREKCDPPYDEGELKKKLSDLLSRELPDAHTPLESFLSDSRPKIRLRGDNRLLSDVASELGPHLSQALYVHNGEVIELQDGSLHPISAQQFRTLAERYVVFYRVRSANGAFVEVGATLDENDARGILASPQFRECLKRLRHLNTVRLPVVRDDGRIELLSQGYDAATETLTDAEVDYVEDVVFADGLAAIRDLFGEFSFSDGERSRAVAVAALLGLYGRQLLRQGELRPAFTYLSNAEGSGKTTLAACAIIPVCGALPISCKAKDDDELRKLQTSAIRGGQGVLFLDNTKGHLNSPALEGFVSAPTWSDRLLGGNETITAPNNVTVFVTSNGATVTPDWRRRSLFAELHLSVERAEDQTFRRPLSAPVLKAMRPQILAACWALVRHWDAEGRPGPSRSHSAFPAWAAIIGGIVEAAGFACPFATAAVAVVADEDGDSMRQLVRAMTPEQRYTATDLVELCRQEGIFEGLLGASEADLGRSQRSAFGKLLARYNDRCVGEARFFIAGSGHARRFLVRPLTANTEGRLAV